MKSQKNRGKNDYESTIEKCYFLAKNHPAAGGL